MALREDIDVGKDFLEEGDAITGLITLDPTGCSKSDPFTAAGDVQVGQAIVLAVKCSGTGPNFPIFSKNSPWKFKFIDGLVINSAAGGAADTAKWQTGDGAASETFTDITDALDCNKSDVVVTRVGTINDAAQIIPEGGSFRVVTASSAPVDAYALVIRVR